MQNETVTYADHPELPPPQGYRHSALSSGPLIHTAGQTWSSTETEDLANIGLREQVRGAVRSSVTALAGAGGSPDGIVSLDVFVVGLSQDTVDDVYRGIGRAAKEAGFGPVPITVLGVAALAVPGALAEVRAIGVPMTGSA
ncbi:RidA family protein [Nocardioides campestrisoli]|uniref:RidA family protein n=1 Tax=Nocardioides campestrisoli TaxID=2736757 RepID=UPI00163D8D77|nr:RidA family protein [Nocardioides campestrisoli]